MNTHNSMKSFFMIILVFAVCSCSSNVKNSNNGKQEEQSNSFEYYLPVDISDVIQGYELYQSSNDDVRDSIKYPFVDRKMCEGEGILNEDTSFVIRLPKYKNSKNKYLASAEEFYNNCSLAFNIWSNFEVWYRNETLEKLVGTTEIIKSIKSIDVNIIKDSDLNKAAQTYKDSIILLMSVGDDKWDNVHNPQNVRLSYFDAIDKYAYYYYDNKDDFQSKFDKIIEKAESMAEEKYQEYLYASETNQLNVILEELNSCERFDEQCSLWRLWANSKKSFSEDAWLVAVGNKLMDSGKYNPILNRIWITWRSICQLYYCGMSNDAIIPHSFYNVYRKRCYITCLKRIEKQQDDIFAMNCASSLAGYHNIFRDGRMSNDALIDAKKMMPKRFESEESNN